MNTKLSVILVILLALAAGAYYWFGVRSAEAPSAGIANPASVNCVETRGGTLELREGPNGQIGICHLPDGRACEEWALLRDGTCQSGETADISAGDLKCHYNAGYFVVERPRGTEVGVDILVKRRMDATPVPECTYAKAEGDFELRVQEPIYYLGLTGNFMLLDEGTAPPPRGLKVYDLTLNEMVYSDQYNRPVEVGESAFTYWQPTKTAPTTENCPDLETLRENGLGAGIERRVKLDLPTQKLTDLNEMRCSARQ